MVVSVEPWARVIGSDWFLRDVAVNGDLEEQVDLTRGVKGQGVAGGRDKVGKDAELPEAICS